MFLKPDGDLEGEVIDPYVKVRIRGHDIDENDINEDGEKIKKNRGKTEHVSNNGFNPIWKEKFEMECKVTDLAFLEFKVKDHSKSGVDKLIGAFCSPLKNIQDGKFTFLKHYA